LGGAEISAENGGISLTGDTGASVTLTKTEDGQATLSVASTDGGTGSGTFNGIAANTIVANSQIASTNTATGAVVVDGGVGISGDINAGGTLTAGLISGGEF
jgi:hypothetical protein